MGKVIILCLCLPLLSFSQQTIQWETHLSGLVCQMSGDTYLGFRKLGFEAGIGGVRSIDSKGHFIGFQLNYIRKGAFYQSQGTEPIFSNYILTMDYLELPVTYLFPMWGVYFEFGLAGSYNLRYKQINNGVEFPEPSNLRWFELGLIGGVNFEINKHLVFGAKYMNSLTPIQEGSVPIYYWFRQGGMHQIIGLRLQYFLNPTTFFWDKKSIAK